MKSLQSLLRILTAFVLLLTLQNVYTQEIEDSETVPTEKSSEVKKKHMHKHGRKHRNKKNKHEIEEENKKEEANQEAAKDEVEVTEDETEVME